MAEYKSQERAGSHTQPQEQFAAAPGPICNTGKLDLDAADLGGLSQPPRCGGGMWGARTSRRRWETGYPQRGAMGVTEWEVKWFARSPQKGSAFSRQ